MRIARRPHPEAAGFRLTRPPVPITADILLLGAGHAHVEVLRRAAMRPPPGIRFTLVAREPQTPYSGMLPGLIRREHDADDAHIDCAPLAAGAGARLIMAEAVGIDLAGRRVALLGRPDIAFDFLSIDVGGTPAMPSGAGIAVKPIGRFLDQLAGIDARLRPGERIAVVGAGPGGAELALALATRFRGRAGIDLVGRESEPVPAAPERARRAVRRALGHAGIAFHGGVMALGYDAGTLMLSDGRALPVAEVLWATGVAAPAFLAASGLACDEVGCIAVDAALRSVSHRHVFAAGDCAALPQPRPKAGVWAVRAGAILAENLRRAAEGRKLQTWRPQRDALVILGLGDHRAVAWRGGWSFSGRLAFTWKNAIDRRWMRKYQHLRAMDSADDMRCGGCGAKLGSQALSDALSGLAGPDRADIPLGLGAADDAAVALPPPGMAVVQSVDHFRAFIDDPYVFGQIAAAHALSDLHAMGARPWTALAIAALPFSPGRRMQEELRLMMLGATEVLTRDGCTLVGGHSAEAAEAALGFSVTGLADPGAIWRKSGILPGDVLVLTKPLGTGIVLAGAMRGLARAAWLQAALASMVRSNAKAAEILRAHDAHACTDITGFGLAGHLREMLRASGVSATLDTGALPVLPGAAELSARGVASTLAPDNHAALDLVAHPALALLTDPQTSGGLLAALPPDRARACLTALLAAGLEAAIIGVAGEAGDAALRLA